MSQYLRPFSLCRAIAQGSPWPEAALRLTRLAHQVPALSVGGGLPGTSGGPPAHSAAQRGCSAPQAWGTLHLTQRPSFSSQAGGGCGRGTSLGPDLLPQFSSALFSPHCQTVFRRQRKSKLTPLRPAASLPSILGMPRAAGGQTTDHWQTTATPACVSPSCMTQGHRCCSPEHQPFLLSCQALGQEPLSQSPLWAGLASPWGNSSIALTHWEQHRKALKLAASLIWNALIMYSQIHLG